MKPPLVTLLYGAAGWPWGWEGTYGFAKATSQTYRLSRGRYIMTLSPDIYLVPGALGRKIEFFCSLLRIFLERFYADDLDF